MITAIAVGFATSVMMVSPLHAADVTAVDGKKITMGDDTVEISSSRTKLTINGNEDVRDNIKVGMDCVAAPTTGEAETMECKDK